MRMLVMLLSLFTHAAMATTYDVPVPADLKDHARWELGYAHAELKEDTLSVHYRLPVELVGKNAPEFRFTAKVTDSFVPVRGDYVRGVCMLSKEKPLTCMLKYPRLAIDEVSRDEALKQKFSNEELPFRDTVVRLFGNDPAGLLMVPISK